MCGEKLASRGQSLSSLAPCKDPKHFPVILNHLRMKAEGRESFSNPCKFIKAVLRVPVDSCFSTRSIRSRSPGIRSCQCGLVEVLTVNNVRATSESELCASELLRLPNARVLGSNMLEKQTPACAACDLPLLTYRSLMLLLLTQTIPHSRQPFNVLPYWGG